MVWQAVLLELASLQALAWCLPGTCMQGAALAGHDAAQGQQPGGGSSAHHSRGGVSVRGTARQCLSCIRTAYRASLMGLVVTVRWLVGEKVTGASAAHSLAFPQAARCLHVVLAWEGARARVLQQCSHCCSAGYGGCDGPCAVPACTGGWHSDVPCVRARTPTFVPLTHERAV